MSYQGCYKDDVESRDLVRLVTLTDDNSPQRCRNECSSVGYPYIGLQVVITTAHCPYIIDTTRIVCGKLICNGRVSVRPSVRLSVPSIDSGRDMQLVCCLPVIDRRLRAPELGLRPASMP